MLSIEKSPVPSNTLLDRYVSLNGTYTDCYRTEVPVNISFSEFVFAFYTTPLFKLERLILKLIVAKPSTDGQARQLAEGSTERFAAWHVEGRNENEILLCDFVELTRSWLMTVPIDPVNGGRTQLYFGSAVVPKRNPKTGKSSLGFGYVALLRFHQIYSILLLYSVRMRLQHLIRSSYEQQNQFHG